MTQPVEFLYLVPVGAVIAWCPPSGGTALPPCFMICDGSTVTDRDSPFYEKALPDLRGMFVLGTAPGATPALRTPTGQAQTNVSGPTNSAAIATTPTQASASDDVTNSIIQAHTPSTAWRYVLSNDLAIQDGNHHHVIGAGKLSLSPPGSIALYYIIRVR